MAPVRLIICPADNSSSKRGGPLLQEQSWDIDELRSCLEASCAREQKAQCAAQIIRRYGYRWVGLYDVGPAEIWVIA